MFKLIAHTLGTKIISVLANFLIIVLASRNLGAANMGDISLIVLSVAVFLKINNIVGGPALVYLLPRHETGTILLLSYIWLIITAGIGALVIFLLELVPPVYFHHVVILSVIFSLLTIHLTVILSREKIKTYNYILAGNSVILLISLAAFIYLAGDKDIYAYIKGLYFAYGTTFLLSTVFLFVKLKKIRFSNFSSVLHDLFKFGSIMQLANILQLLNYRMNYYLIERFWNKTTLGIYSVGNEVSEGIWLLSQSTATVLYPKVSNSKDEASSVKTVLFFLKMIALLTVLMISVLLLLPTYFYTFIFGEEFTGTKLIILSLSEGIFFLSLSRIFSTYFSGTGKPQINTIASAIGLVMVTGFGLWLIPRWAFVGAGITASITYFSSFMFQLIIFVRKTKLKAGDFLIGKEDIDKVKSELQNFLKNGK